MFASNNLRRTALLFSLGCVLAAQAARAQVVDTILGNRLVGSHRFAAPGHDSLLISLRHHGEYRIAVWPAAASIYVTRAGARADTVFTSRASEGHDDRPTIIEAYPTHDGVHILTVSAPAGAGRVLVWVWEDSLAEAVAHGRSERRWGIGLSIAGGMTSGYRLGTEGASGATPIVEAAVLVGSGSRFALRLGGGNDPRKNGHASVGWAFAEPQLRLVTVRTAGHDLDVNAVLRVAGGSQSGLIAHDPSMVAAGAAMAWHLDRHHAARGMILGVEALYARLQNLPVPNSTVRVTATLSWMP